MIAQQYVHDHVMHFYHLHALDWVDVVNCLKADPAQTSAIQQKISPWPNSSPSYFAGVQKKVQAIVDSGQLSIFANAYWGHPAYKLPPEINLLAVAHYLEALDWQKDAVKIHTIFGGKNPHPNFVVGGVPMPIDLNSDTALNADRLSIISDSIDKMIAFVDQVYLPDLLAIAPYYLEYGGIGEGLGNFLTWGEFPGEDNSDISKFMVPRAVILNRDLANIQVPDPRDFQRMQEFVARSWYGYKGGDQSGLHPWQGETEFNYTGPKPPYDYLNVDQKYSWLKAPRWAETPMEVGPLARVLAMYAGGHAQTKELVDLVLKTLDVPISAVFSTLGRTAARAIETKVYRRRDAHLLQRPDRRDQSWQYAHLRGQQVGTHHLARPRAGLWLYGSAARRVGSLDCDRRTVRSKTTRWSSPPPGTAHPATTRVSLGHMKPRWSEPHWRNLNGLSKSCVPFTPSTPAWRAPFTW